MKITGPGRYTMRDGGIATVTKASTNRNWPWNGTIEGEGYVSWSDDGRYSTSGHEYRWDIVSGPLPTPTFAITGPGIYTTRKGCQAIVEMRVPGAITWPWAGTIAGKPHHWSDDGRFDTVPDDLDLVSGPLPIGPPVVPRGELDPLVERIAMALLPSFDPSFEDAPREIARTARAIAAALRNPQP